MPHPKKRTSKSAKNERRSHHSLKEIFIAVCEKCGGAIKPHHACTACGFYNGKDFSKKEVKVEKKAQPKAKKEVKSKKEESVKKEKSVAKEEKK